MARPWTVVTWNVNGIRARLDNVTAYLAERAPDVVLLQETKVDDARFPKVPFLELGYRVEVFGDGGYAGVAIASKDPMADVQRGFAEGEPDRACRILAATIRGVRVYALYAPNGTEIGSEAFAYKLAWFRRLRDELAARYSPDDPVLLGGDFNVVPDDRDVYDPEGLRGTLHLTDEERAALSELCGFGLVDCFRARSDAAGVYSWYDYRHAAFARRMGMRIDLLLATRPLADRCVEVIHDEGPRTWPSHSDRLPVAGRFDLPAE